MIPGLGLFAAAVVASAALAGGLSSEAPKPSEPLPGFQNVSLRVWDWSAPFVPSSWGQPSLGGYIWRPENAAIRGGALALSVTEKGSAEVQTNAAALSSRARWEADATMPKMRSGLIAAPLWTFNKDTQDEIDFEVVGLEGLQVTIWTSVNGRHTPVWARNVMRGDLSNRRLRLVIEYEAGERVRFLVDGVEVANVTPADTPLGFPSGPQKPLFSLWVANGLHPDWAGRWTPMDRNQSLTMFVHGYRAEALPS